MGEKMSSTKKIGQHKVPKPKIRGDNHFRTKTYKSKLCISRDHAQQIYKIGQWQIVQKIGERIYTLIQLWGAYDEKNEVRQLFSDINVQMKIVKELRSEKFIKIGPW